jgi:hypothetical protein
MRRGLHHDGFLELLMSSVATDTRVQTPGNVRIMPISHAGCTSMRVFIAIREYFGYKEDSGELENTGEGYYDIESTHV